MGIPCRCSCSSFPPTVQRGEREAAGWHPAQGGDGADSCRNCWRPEQVPCLMAVASTCCGNGTWHRRNVVSYPTTCCLSDMQTITFLTPTFRGRSGAVPAVAAPQPKDLGAAASTDAEKVLCDASCAADLGKREKTSSGLEYTVITPGKGQSPPIGVQVSSLCCGRLLQVCDYRLCSL